MKINKLRVINLSVTSRTTSDSTGLVSDRNPPLHRPAELEVLGGSTYCKSYDRLFKAQVWHFVSPQMEDESKAQWSSLKTMQSLFSPHRRSSLFFSFVQLTIFHFSSLHFSSSNCWTIAEVSDGCGMRKYQRSARRGCCCFSWWYLRFIVIHV